MRRSRDIHGGILGFSRAGALIGNTEAARRGSHATSERLTRFHGLALFAGPGAYAALPGSGAKIRVAFGVRQRFHQPLNAHLAVAMIPVKYHRGPVIGLDLPTLARSIVGVEDDTAELGVDVLAEHDSRRWVAVGVHGRQYHGVRIRLGGVLSGLRQPLSHDDKGVRRQGVRQRFRPMSFYIAAHLSMVSVLRRLR